MSVKSFNSAMGVAKLTLVQAVGDAYGASAKSMAKILLWQPLTPTNFAVFWGLYE